LLGQFEIVDRISMFKMPILISTAESTSSPKFLRSPDLNKIIEHAMLQVNRCGTLSPINTTSPKAKLSQPQNRTPLSKLLSPGCELPAAHATSGITYQRAINPDSRSAQFTHLKDDALFQAIKDLCPWQQTQELTLWFKPIDVIIAYLKDEEGLQTCCDISGPRSTVADLLVQTGTSTHHPLWKSR
jgi:hypothetical protein